mmetsp:Transcript_1192/g.2522  ORF Transcript_1192/g.2522 Transcript_1192/m.2522 type:complete len:100 (+) Transcript_1192:791-1090(+)
MPALSLWIFWSTLLRLILWELSLGPARSECAAWPQLRDLASIRARMLAFSSSTLRSNLLRLMLLELCRQARAPFGALPLDPDEEVERRRAQGGMGGGYC